ncbi:MAG: type II and iii secretion system protein, partial [Variovorax sp.]
MNLKRCTLAATALCLVFQAEAQSPYPGSPAVPSMPTMPSLPSPAAVSGATSASPVLRPAASPAAPSGGAGGAERSPGIRTAGPPPPPASITEGELQRIAARATVMQRLPETLTLYVGQMVLVKMPGVARVAIGSGKVLEARVLDGANMLITAQDAGDSTLHV